MMFLNPVQRILTMPNPFLATIIVIASLVMVHLPGHAAEPHVKHQGIELPADLLNLLREEMREISGGVQNIALHLATADWASIHTISTKIKASYIMERKLTPSQKKELGQTLPEYFKQLDAEFHLRADKLGEAAANHDHELTAFHYSRLIESCVRCHSTFANNRFPGFGTETSQDHHH